MRVFGLVLTALVALGACQSSSPSPKRVEKAKKTPKPSAKTPKKPSVKAIPKVVGGEQPVVRLALTGPVADPKVEISGMAWWGDRLVLMPQYPGKKTAGGNLYTLDRSEVLEAVKSGGVGTLTPKAVPFEGPNGGDFEGFEGYEALAFEGDTVWMLIETSEKMQGILVTGAISKAVSVSAKPSAVLAAQNPKLGNQSYEALLVAPDALVAFYEANGRKTNGRALIKRFDRSLKPLPDLPMTSVEFRVTDVTAPDSEGRFWAINYQYSGDKKLRAERDPIAEQHGKGDTHTAKPDTVERLIELRYSPEGGVTKTGRPPIQLQLGKKGRNWEGIARLGDQGFLLVTDMHPKSDGTILAFVPMP